LFVAELSPSNNIQTVSSEPPSHITSVTSNNRNSLIEQDETIDPHEIALDPTTQIFEIALGPSFEAHQKTTSSSKQSWLLKEVNTTVRKQRLLDAIDEMEDGEVLHSNEIIPVSVSQQLEQTNIQRCGQLSTRPPQPLKHQLDKKVVIFDENALEAGEEMIEDNNLIEEDDDLGIVDEKEDNDEEEDDVEEEEEYGDFMKALMDLQGKDVEALKSIIREAESL
jgi:hypothetical protein